MRDVQTGSGAEAASVLFALQHRIAAGVKQMLELWFHHKPFPEDFYIVREGKLAEQYT